MSTERLVETKSITWEELVEEHEKEVAFQNKYFFLPTFRAKALIEETRPILREGQEIISKEGVSKGVRTNISQMEIIYPFLLKKAGLVSEELPQWAVTEKINKGAITGEMLHKADAIFSVALHGIRGRLLSSYLHTFEEEDVGRIDHALSDIHIPLDADEEEIAAKLKIAWSRYRSILQEKEAVNLTLPNFGMVDPRAERRYKESFEIDEAANTLAEAWAKEAVKTNPMTWEFQRSESEEVINQREVLAAIKFMGPNLQFIARLDSTVRLKPTSDEEAEKKRKGGKVTSQVVDLKSGIQTIGSSLDAEIKNRQAQVMRVMTECFTAKYLTNYKSLAHKGSAFPMKANHDSRAGGKRVDLAGYRHIDLKT